MTAALIIQSTTGSGSLVVQGTGLQGPAGVAGGVNPISWTDGAGTPATTGSLRFPAPTPGLYNEYLAAVGRNVANSADWPLVRVIQSNASTTAAQFGDPNHIASTLAGTTSAVATATLGGLPSGSYVGVRSDGLAFANMSRNLGCAIFEWSDSLVSDFSIRFECNFNGYNVVRSCATSLGTEFRSDTSTFFGFEQPVGGVDNHVQNYVFGANPTYSAGPFRYRRRAVSTTDANYTLTNADIPNVILEIGGAWSAGRNVVAPLETGAIYWVKNNTTGGFSATFKTSGGSGVVIANGKGAWVYCDGTNYVRMTADV